MLRPKRGFSFAENSYRMIVSFSTFVCKDAAHKSNETATSRDAQVIVTKFLRRLIEGRENRIILIAIDQGKQYVVQCFTPVSASVVSAFRYACSLHPFPPQQLSSVRRHP